MELKTQILSYFGKKKIVVLRVGIRNQRHSGEKQAVMNMCLFPLFVHIYLSVSVTSFHSINMTNNTLDVTGSADAVTPTVKCNVNQVCIRSM